MKKPIFKKFHTEASIIVALLYALYLGLVTSKQVLLVAQYAYRLLFLGSNFRGTSFLEQSLLKQYYRTV